METIPKEKQRITPEKAAALLKQRGTDLTPEQAALVVELFYALALIFYHQQDEL